MTEEQTKGELEKAQPTSALVKRAETVKSMLESYRPQIAAALPKHISPDRMLRIALTEGQRPEILKCWVGSFIAAVLQSAQLGLVLDRAMGHAYLVPFWNRNTKREEVQLIPGYRGLVHLVRQTGKLDRFESRIVYQRDAFDLSYGLTDSLIHRPYIERPGRKRKVSGPGPVIGAYAIARFKGGDPQTEWMPVVALDAIRARSKAASNGPWVTDTEEMYRKTVAKRICKWLPMSTELAMAIELDNRHEAGEPQALPDVKVTSLPAVALIEAPDPVIEAYGTGGEESASEAPGSPQETTSAPEAQTVDPGPSKPTRAKAGKEAPLFEGDPE